MIAFENQRTTTLNLFSTLHDATREMLATDPISRYDIENIHDHLCIRRFFYEDAYLKENTVAVSLTEADSPTAGDILYERCEVSRSFFESLQFLRINDISYDRIERALESVNVQLDHLIKQAERLNAIEHNRPIDLTGFETTALEKPKSRRRVKIKSKKNP